MNAFRATVGLSFACLLAVIAGAASCSSSETTLSREQLMDPETCKECHADHYREWSGSMHAYAAEDPVFLAMNRRGQRETNGQLGDFCVRCHAPLAVQEGATKDGLNLSEVSPKLKGVTCYFCHSVDAVEGTHNNPLKLATDGAMRGGISDPSGKAPHAAKYSTLHDRTQPDSSKLCGACHDIVNGHGTHIERTFAEWGDSVFANPVYGLTCSKCHMFEPDGERPIAEVDGVPARKYHLHTFAGVDVAITPFPEQEAQRSEVERELAGTLQTAVCIAQLGGAFSARVILDNVGAGHRWPSGASADRRVWVDLQAFAGGTAIYESGHVAADEPVVDRGAPDLWLLRDCLLDDQNSIKHMFWEAKGFEALTLPAQITFDRLDPAFYATNIVQRFPRDATGLIPGTPDTVRMRVWVRPIGLDVLDDLIGSGDLDPKFRSTMPTMPVGDELVWTADRVDRQYVDSDGSVLECVTNSNVNVSATLTPATIPAFCKP